MHGSWRLCDITTGGETRIYHRPNWSQSQLTQTGLLKDESSTTVARRGRFEPRTLFSIFFKSNGSVLIHVVDKDKTVDHHYYIENCLKPVVQKI